MPTLILLHAFASSGASFDAMVDRLAPTRRCVAFDLRGFGRSPAGSGYSVERHAADVLAQVADEVDGDFVLVGHSMGGKVAIAAAAARPRGLVGLVLLAPSPPTPESITDEERAERLAAHGDEAAARASLANIIGGPVAAADVERFVADSLACSPAAWRWWLTTGSREDISALVPTIAVPILVMLGCADPVIPLDALDGPLLKPHPGASLTLLAGAGHLLPIERSATCVAVIDRFVGARHHAP